MMNYQLLIDTWEGQLEVDEGVLRENGVAGMVIRLNDMNGGHHLDTNFLSQWEQARGFVRAPYFVYNPWVDGAANFAWLNEHMPADARAVMADIEVRYAGITPAKYAADVSLFIDLVKRKWNVGIYTGEWFLSMLSFWRNDVAYWWAQYPYKFYPSEVRHLSWDQLRAELEPFTGPSNAARCPGPLRMWQFTGDRLVLPGNAKPMDVNAFFGSYAELEGWLGKAEGSDDGGAMAELFLGTIVTPALNVRSVPSSSGNNPVRMLVKGQHVIASGKVNGWWKLSHIDQVPVNDDLYAFEGANNGYIRQDDVVRAAGAKPVIRVSQTFSADGYSDFTVAGEWKPNV